MKGLSANWDEGGKVEKKSVRVCSKTLEITWLAV